MNKFKVYTMELSFTAFLAVVLCTSLFCMGCSGENGNFVGTSEEPNEIIAQGKSSSDELVESSSSNVEPEVMSSSSKNPDNRGSDSPNTPLSSSRVASSSSRAISSSSEDRNTQTPQITSSSSRGDVNEGTPMPNSLNYYLDLLHLDSDSFDNAVLSTKRDRNDDFQAANPVPSARSTDFDSPWPRKVVKQNVDALGSIFPTAVEEYPEIITAIKNETLDEKCGLYTFNVYGDGKAAAFIVAKIAKDTITVLDIPAGDCNAISSSDMSRFLFYYCGELDERPDVVHVPVENSLSAKCSVLRTENEWVKDK